MTRSYKKNPVYGITTAKSEKEDKQIWHGRLRSIVRDKISACQFEAIPHIKEVSNPWLMAKDGKLRYDSAWNRKRKADCKINGICSWCHVRPVAKYRQTCPTCSAKKREKQKIRNRTVRAIRSREGKCTRCGAELSLEYDSGKRTCVPCRTASKRVTYGTCNR